MGKIIQTLHGKIEGLETESAYIFRGVPYVKPPIGELRFHAPLPCHDWDGVLETKEFSCREFQGEQQGFYKKEFYHGQEYETRMSEDCLYLNIWVPKMKSDNKEGYPVAIWIHGGGFAAGYGSEREFDGEAYAKRGVVLITINYRIGIFGFFCHPELTKRDGYSGNYGILDQIAAIDWVRENISAFGGNGQNITVFGQSAGGYSVRCLVESPLARGKFQKAIMQSCGGYKAAVLNEIRLEKLERLCEGFLRKRKLTLDDCMKLDGAELAKLSEKFRLYGMLHGRELFCLIPVVDGRTLTDRSDNVVDKADTMDIPYLVGCTKNDIFVSRSGAKDRKKSKIYQASVNWCIEHNRRAVPAYAYYFSHDLPGDKKGAFHSAELWYMFGTLERSWRPFTEEDRKLSDQMLDGWTSFMKTGDPGWAKCTEDNQYVEEFR